MENIMKVEKCVKESFVWGSLSKDNSIQICAKIVLNDDKDIDKCIKEIDERIKEINLDIPKYKIIRYFVVTTEELTKTTTLKIKRNIEKEKMEKLLQEKNVDIVDYPEIVKHKAKYENKKIILYLARIVEEKRPLFVVHVLKKLCETHFLQI